MFAIQFIPVMMTWHLSVPSQQVDTVGGHSSGCMCTHSVQGTRALKPN